MRYCRHSQWLGLAMKDGQVFLQSTDRLQNILEDLENPGDQHPSLLVFIGNKSKALAIKELVPRYSSGRRSHYPETDEAPQTNEASLHERRKHGEIHLHIYSSATDRPMLLAEGDFPSLEKPGRELVPQRCHETMSRQLQSPGLSARPLMDSADAIYFKYLSAFADVFCFFAADVGGFRPIVHRLSAWFRLGQPSTLPKNTRPKILIVTEASDESDEAALARFIQMLSGATNVDPSQHFSGIHLLSLLPRRDVSNRARHRELKEELLNLSDRVRYDKILTQSLFSARHLAAFLRLALDHVVRRSAEPFNFITNSRSDRPVVKDLHCHMAGFLQYIKTARALSSFAIPVLASSMLLDSYPPEIHVFPPLEVFRTLYKDACIKAYRASVFVHGSAGHMVLPSDFIKLLEDEFVEQFEVRIDGFLPIATWHQKVLSDHEHEWVNLHSDETCLVCNAERPQYGLPCKHIIGENCVREFGQRIDAWKYGLRRCILCQVDTPGIVINFMPPTAAPRLLCVDGGGVRGIIPLTFLQVLEETIDLPYPVQDNFDFAYGTSSGGIIVLALYKRAWPIAECITQFERLAKLAFQQSILAQLGTLLLCFRLLSLFRGLLVLLVTDRIYPARNLEAALRSVYGSQSGILDCSSSTATSTRIGVVVSSMEPRPYIFTNYNSIGERSTEAYGVLGGNTPVWEIFFTTKSILGLGKFQDGGLNHNNPIELGLREVKAVTSAKKATLKVSLGTGLSKKQSRLQDSATWWSDMWFLRLFRAFWSSMDSQEASDAIRTKERDNLRSELKTGEKKRRGEYFRFNLRFDGKGPSLDDTSKISDMKIMARESMLQSGEVIRLAQSLVSKLFVFELREVGRKENDQYQCVGHILCRCRAGSPALDALIARLVRSTAYFYLQGRSLTGTMSDRMCFSEDGNFTKEVHFNISSKTDLISLQLHENGGEPYDISASPFSIEWLISAQGLDRVFSAPTHTRKRKIGEIGGGSRCKRVRA
ncbi:related to calcium-independent phospholipase A2 [Phialocephala subalpina]|uniref:Related to calcium-independent phospholipase A2 n=1 Tax=Phialocephala subalpina TaxID=576137 RepID=A0A1L7XJY3_9HELO|nr:related to calcium-independent phospholipase A2 [Phialocephala subalpina]